MCHYYLGGWLYCLICIEDVKEKEDSNQMRRKLKPLLHVFFRKLNCSSAKWTKWNICEFLSSFFKIWFSLVSACLRDAYLSWSSFHCLSTSVVLSEASYEKEKKQQLSLMFSKNTRYCRLGSTGWCKHWQSSKVSVKLWCTDNLSSACGKWEESKNYEKMLYFISITGSVQ